MGAGGCAKEGDNDREGLESGDSQALVVSLENCTASSASVILSLRAVSLVLILNLATFCGKWGNMEVLFLPPPAFLFWTLSQRPYCAQSSLMAELW